MKLTTLLHSLDPKIFRKPVFQQTLLRMLPISILLMLFSVYNLGLARDRQYEIALVATIVMFLALPLATAFVSARPAVILRNSRSAFTRKRLIELDENGFTTRFDSGSNSFTVWNDIESSVHRGELVMLYMTKLFVINIPDSAWPSTVERDQFLDLLRTKGLLK